LVGIENITDVEEKGGVEDGNIATRYVPMRRGHRLMDTIVDFS
jgi:hypothetical protein